MVKYLLKPMNRIPIPSAIITAPNAGTAARIRGDRVCRPFDEGKEEPDIRRSWTSATPIVTNVRLVLTYAKNVRSLARWSRATLPELSRMRSGCGRRWVARLRRDGRCACGCSPWSSSLEDERVCSGASSGWVERVGKGCESELVFAGVAVHWAVGVLVGAGGRWVEELSASAHEERPWSFGFCETAVVIRNSKSSSAVMFRCVVFIDMGVVGREGRVWAGAERKEEGMQLR